FTTAQLAVCCALPPSTRPRSQCLKAYTIQRAIYRLVMTKESVIYPRPPEEAPIFNKKEAISIRCGRNAPNVGCGSRLCENVLEPRMRGIAFSISFSRQSWKVQLVFTSTKSRGISTRKLNVRVFTQPGSKGEILAKSRCFPLWSRKRTQVRHRWWSGSCH